MGSSAKKKSTKKKESQKTKLKVGKPKPKPANFTDTSFKAKSIVLQKQSLTTTAPTFGAQFAHHVSLLGSKSDDQRSESLAYLTATITGRPQDAPLPEPASTLLTKAQPLIVDGSPAVRRELLRFLQCIPAHDVARQPDNLLLYTHVAMTHLSADIRSFALDILNWLTKTAGREVVSCPGGWMKTLRCLVRQLGWEQQTKSNGWSNVQSAASKPGIDKKVVSHQLQTMAAFITAGIGPPSQEALKGAAESSRSYFPVRDFEAHHFPQRSNAFGHLHLFGPPPDEDGAAYEDREDRQRLFVDHFKTDIVRGLNEVKKEGGELGRASAMVNRAVEEGLLDYGGA